MTDVTQIQTTYWESLQRKKVKSHPKDNCREKRELERKVTELSAFKGGTFWSQLSDKMSFFLFHLGKFADRSKESPFQLGTTYCSANVPWRLFALISQFSQTKEKKWQIST